MDFLEALRELREKTKKRNFDQTLDLIINLKDFDVKRESLSIVVPLPHPFKKKRIAAFLENPGDYEFLEKIITKTEMEKMTQKDIKKMAKKVDFFIANVKLMPAIASKFGKILGSLGKMPDPSLGCVIAQEDKETIKKALEKLNIVTKVKTKEPSIKIAIGKESMPNEDLIKNIDSVLKTVKEKLPKKEMNIKNVMLKFTMSKALEVKK
ncbi:MAG: hypothetical protein QXP53_01635 [Candidatus Pacearchaeota archaeon]